MTIHLRMHHLALHDFLLPARRKTLAARNFLGQPRRQRFALVPLLVPVVVLMADNPFTDDLSFVRCNRDTHNNIFDWSAGRRLRMRVSPSRWSNDNNRRLRRWRRLHHNDWSWRRWRLHDNHWSRRRRRVHDYYWRSVYRRADYHGRMRYGRTWRQMSVMDDTTRSEAQDHAKRQKLCFHTLQRLPRLTLRHICAQIIRATAYELEQCQ